MEENTDDNIVVDFDLDKIEAAHKRLVDQYRLEKAVEELEADAKTKTKTKPEKTKPTKKDIVYLNDRASASDDDYSQEIGKYKHPLFGPAGQPLDGPAGRGMYYYNGGTISKRKPKTKSKSSQRKNHDDWSVNAWSTSDDEVTDEFSLFDFDDDEEEPDEYGWWDSWDGANNKTSDDDLQEVRGDIEGLSDQFRTISDDVNETLSYASETLPEVLELKKMMKKITRRMDAMEDNIISILMAVGK